MSAASEIVHWQSMARFSFIFFLLKFYNKKFKGKIGKTSDQQMTNNIASFKICQKKVNLRQQKKNVLN